MQVGDRYHEDGGSMLLRNVSTDLPDYTELTILIQLDKHCCCENGLFSRFRKIRPYVSFIP
jgi:hypothetical protein